MKITNTDIVSTLKDMSELIQSTPVVKAHLLLAAAIVNKATDDALAQALEDLINKVPWTASLNKKGEIEFQLLDEIEKALSPIIDDCGHGFTRGVGCVVCSKEEMELYDLYYQEAIGNPVHPHRYTEEIKVFHGTKTECRNFAKDYNWIRAVWTMRSRHQSGDVEQEVIFLNSLRPKHFQDLCDIAKGVSQEVDMCCHGKCQDITRGILRGNTVTCETCGHSEEYEVAD